MTAAIQHIGISKCNGRLQTQINLVVSEALSMGTNNFMTTKEKNYVAECFRRNMRYFKSDLDYSTFFDQARAEKIDIRNSEDEPKKNTSLLFGKESKRGNRKLRPSFGLNLEELSSSLKTKFLLENLVGLYTIRKYCKLTEAGLDENKKSLKSLLLANFNTFVSIGKFFKFLEIYLKEAGEDERKEVIVLLQKTFHLVGNIPQFYEFIDSSINSIPRIPKDSLEPGFTSTFLSFPSGIILATSLLIQNEELSTVFCEMVLAEPTVSFMKDKYAWQFLSVLVSLVEDERQRSIVKKAQPRLVRIFEKPKNEEAEEVKIFLETIGVRPENIIKK